MTESPPNDQPISFRKWLWNWQELKTQGKFIPILGVLLTLTSFIVGRFNGLIITEFDEKYMTYLLVFFNVLVLFFAVFTPLEYEKFGKYRIKNQRNQKYFNGALKGFWLSTLFLYFIIGFKYSKENYSDNGKNVGEKTQNDIYDINAEIANYSIEFKKQQESFVRNYPSKAFPAVEYYKPRMFEQILEDSVFNFVRLDKYNKNYIYRIEQCSDSLFSIASSVSPEMNLDSSLILKNYLLEIYKYANFLRIESETIKKVYKLKTIKALQFIEVFISDIGSFFLFLAFLILYNPEKNIKSLLIKGQWWIYIFVFGTSIAHFLLLTFWHSAEDAYHVIKLFSGIFSALAMSLLVARFESTKMQSPLGLLIILYLYAIIQSVFGLFGIVIASFHYLSDDFAYTIALLGKTVLYLYILWIYSTKRIFFYFEEKLSQFYDKNSKESD